MQFKPYIWLIGFLSLNLVITSCKEDIPAATKESGTVNISITSPVSNEVVSGPTEVHLDGIIDADAMLGGWKSILIDTETEEVVDEFDQLYSQTQYHCSSSLDHRTN